MGTKKAKTLQKADVTTLSNEECKQTRYKSFLIDNKSRITDDKVCAQGSKNGKLAGICQGDSGGPTVCSGTIHAVTSFSTGCGWEGYPGVNSRVYEHLLWIKSYVGAGIWKQTVSGGGTCADKVPVGFLHSRQLLLEPAEKWRLYTLFLLPSFVLYYHCLARDLLKTRWQTLLYSVSDVVIDRIAKYKFLEGLDIWIWSAASACVWAQRIHRQGWDLDVQRVVLWLLESNTKVGAWELWSLAVLDWSNGLRIVFFIHNIFFLIRHLMVR